MKNGYFIGNINPTFSGPNPSGVTIWSHGPHGPQRISPRPRPWSSAPPWVPGTAPSSPGLARHFGWFWTRRPTWVQQRSTWLCLKMVVPHCTQWLMIIIPIKWLFHWEYTLFSDKPTSPMGCVLIGNSCTFGRRPAEPHLKKNALSHQDMNCFSVHAHSKQVDDPLLSNQDAGARKAAGARKGSFLYQWSCYQQNWYLPASQRTVTPVG